jgi:hypothetical protein
MTLPTKKTTKTNNDRQQLAAFRKAARELGADASDEQFQNALRKVAKHKPNRPQPKKQKSG